MIRLRSHPAYKPSGIEWVGDIPAHWDVKPLFALMREVKNLNTGIVEKNLLSLSYGNIVRKDIDQSEGLLPDSFETYNIIEQGDIVLRLTDLQNDKRSLRSAISHERGIITSAYLTLRTLVATEYYSHLFRAYDVMKVFYSMGGGLRQSLRFEDVRRIPLLVPPAIEAAKVTRYINREAARIDSLIANKTRFIGLLKEKRQALITHAVTKGLNPDVPMKDSGIEWLGKVPAHWVTWKVSRAFDVIGSGTTPPSNETKWYENGGVPWVTTSELRENIVRETSRSVSAQAIQQYPTLRTYPPGSVAVAMYGATIGRLGIFGIAATTNQACCVLASPRHLEPVFIFYWFQAFKDAIVGLYAIGGGQPNINQDVVRGLRVPAPDLAEQKEIAADVQAKCDKVDELIRATECSIELLRERRSALITAAVTGKIDLRDAA